VVLAVSAAAFCVGGCHAPNAKSFVFDVRLNPGEPFRRARAQCRVERAKVAAPYLAMGEPEYADKYGDEAFVDCMRGKGYRLLRTEEYYDPT
jgi:hypothetical protein